MSEPRDMRDLVGDDVSAGELEALERVDALLRTVPAPPPHVPEALTRAVTRGERSARPWARRRIAAVLPLAAALAGVFFGFGMLVGREDFEPDMTVEMTATAAARGATAEVRISDRDESGNFGMEVEVSGLPKLPKGGYYVLWLAKNGEYAATCGTFAVGDNGNADVYMNASYALRDYDAFVITAQVPGQPHDEEPPWLLKADIA